MAKTVFCAIAVMLCAVCASAQEFFSIEGVVQKETSFYVLAESNKSVQVNPLVYKIVKKSPQDFVVCYLEGKTENFLTVARREDVKRVVCEVDSVGFGSSEDIVKIFFTDGSSYEDPDPDLLTLQKGQKIEFTSILGMTQNFWRHRTVSRDTPAAELDVFAPTLSAE